MSGCSVVKSKRQVVSGVTKSAQKDKITRFHCSTECNRVFKQSRRRNNFFMSNMYSPLQVNISRNRFCTKAFAVNDEGSNLLINVSDTSLRC